MSLEAFLTSNIGQSTYNITAVNIATVERIFIFIKEYFREKLSKIFRLDEFYSQH